MRARKVGQIYFLTLGSVTISIATKRNSLARKIAARILDPLCGLRPRYCYRLVKTRI